MKSENNRSRNRQAAVAGRFYPDSGKKLREEVETLFAEAKPANGSGQKLRALIVPHAGYVFSGKVAASGFNHIPVANPPRRVFVLASSHHYHFPGASVYCSGNYETPLGTVTVDCETGKKLTEGNGLISDNENAHFPEHSVEVQLPFLQVKLGKNLNLVPIILGNQQPEECRKIAEILRPFFTRENLFVISSDFSHYPSYEDAIAADRATTEAILSNSPENLMKTLDSNRHQKIPGLATSLCGWPSVLTLLYLTSGNNFTFEWIDYQNSGDQPVYGDHFRVVGYSAIAIYENNKPEFELTEEDKEKLLQIARNSVYKMVTTGKRIRLDEKLFSGHLADHAGAFVSIYIAGKLRGCIGTFEHAGTLADVVNKMAASATCDRRFEQVSEDELNDLSIEISVLTPLKKISSINEIELGKHGIYIKKGWYTGTFLPQVAEKYGWNLEEFLGRCSRDKAGIGWDGWKTADLYTYEAFVFGRE